MPEPIQTLAGVPIPQPPRRDFSAPPAPPENDDDIIGATPLVRVMPTVNQTVTIPAPVIINEVFREVRNTTPPHNKFYRVCVTRSGEFWSLTARYGRIGARGLSRVISGPLSLLNAVATANRILAVKIQGGYNYVSQGTFGGFSPEDFENVAIPAPAFRVQPASALAAPHPLPPAPVSSNAIQPALRMPDMPNEFFPINQITRAQAMEEIFQHDTILQAERSSDRIMLRRDALGVCAYTGTTPVNLPDEIKRQAQAIPTGFELDGYLVNGVFEAIDVLTISGNPVRQARLLERLQRLITDKLTSGSKMAVIKMAPVACSDTAKKAMLSAAEQNNQAVFIRQETSAYRSACSCVKLGRRCAF